MLRRTDPSLHRTGRLRGYVLKDATLAYAAGRGGARTLNRSGVGYNAHAKQQTAKYADLNASEPTKHAFPLLTHTDFGHQDHAANTKWVELGNYMPKRNKGTPPWWRGADTYSPLYAEQGRYEYQRYLMVSRFPSQFKRHFQIFLGAIRATARPGAREHVTPQEALHWILRMIVDNFNPQHAHYLAAMRALMSAGEFDMARDVWRVMERQQTWPDDKLLACYLELCALAGEKTWAIECWNRYCNEKTFLGEREADPKPVARVPFTLNRDELLYLPKWKKHFDHDPNLDVADLNRFNTTRNIHRWMCVAMLATGEAALFEALFAQLTAALLATRTPVPEPPHPQMAATPKPWGADPNRDARRHKQWRPDLQTKRHCEIAEMNARFLSNEQFLVRTAVDCISHYCNRGGAAAAPIAGVQPQQQRSLAVSDAEAVAFCDKMLARVRDALGPERWDAVSKHSLYATALAVHRTRGCAGGDKVLQLLRTINASTAGGASSSSDAASASAASALPAAVHGACYLEVLRAYADECGAGRKFDPRAVLAKVTDLASKLADSADFEWTSDHHLAVLRVLSNCGTMTANRYFVANVLRKFAWDSDFCEVLYAEYRRHQDADHWAELTKRMLVWTQRYSVKLSERCRRLIEKDYDVIKVQVRSFREVAVFSFRDASEKKESLDPAAQLPNPVMDYVSHALPFPDRDTGYPNEYGDIGQWRDPASGIKGPENYAPPMHDDAQRGYTAEWRENTATANAVKMPAPWDKKYLEYNRGRHPSYDQVYAGPFPEIFPARYDFRRPTRWDFQNIENQSKFKFAGPY